MLEMKGRLSVEIRAIFSRYNGNSVSYLTGMLFLSHQYFDLTTSACSRMSGRPVITFFLVHCTILGGKRESQDVSYEVFRYGQSKLIGFHIARYA